MPIYKNKTIFSEISSFFKKNDSQSAIFTIIDMIKSVNMPEKVLFGTQGKFNSKYSLLQVFQLLIMFLCFMIKNPFNYRQSSLRHFFGCEKDVFYRFANNEAFDWRKVLYHITDFVIPGENELVIEVVNNWMNRLIGDQNIPENQRDTWCFVNPYNRESILQPSGLFGPVTINRFKPINGIYD